MVQHYEVVDLMGYIFNTCDGFPVSGHFNGEDEVMEYETFGGVGWAVWTKLCLVLDRTRLMAQTNPSKHRDWYTLWFPLVIKPFAMDNHHF